MSNKSNNNTTTTETMAQRHTRLFNTAPLAVALESILSDWRSGNMSLSRMEAVMSNELTFFRSAKGFKKYVGKLERIGRLGKTGYAFNPSMGNITPNEIGDYMEACINFLEDAGNDRMTLEQFAEMVTR